MTAGQRVRTVIWTVEWAKPWSRRGGILRDRIWELEPDIVCVCEAMDGWMPGGGHSLAPGQAYGPLAGEGQRKVMLWSRQPWEHADRLGDPSLPTWRGCTAPPVDACSAASGSLLPRANSLFGLWQFRSAAGARWLRALEKRPASALPRGSARPGTAPRTDPPSAKSLYLP